MSVVGLRQADVRAYMRNELIPFLFAQEFLKMVEECESLLVWNTGEGVIRILAL